MSVRSTIWKHSWGWALCLSLGVHILVVSRLGFPWQTGLGKLTPPPSLTIDLDWAAALTPAPGGNLSSKPSMIASSRPVPLAAHAMVSAPVASRLETEPAPSPAAPVAPMTTDDRHTPANSLVWNSLGMARQLVANPWVGRRITYLNAATTQPEWLAYEEAFSHKVAEVGGLNYPPPQNGHPLSGAVRVATVLNADGSVAAVELLQSSGQPELDRAAQRIVQMAAPFLPFTETMRAHTDLVRIVRTFNFVRAGEPLGSQ
ncbi:MAG: TonB family protein [Betaproteobacteria bacterium]|jgi:TonB family C-terminal domain|nr:TonB family protein [Betaproteobacteria bacterium]